MYVLNAMSHQNERDVVVKVVTGVFELCGAVKGRVGQDVSTFAITGVFCRWSAVFLWWNDLYIMEKKRGGA